MFLAIILSLLNAPAFTQDHIISGACDTIPITKTNVAKIYDITLNLEQKVKILKFIKDNRLRCPQNIMPDIRGIMILAQNRDVAKLALSLYTNNASESDLNFLETMAVDPVSTFLTREDFIDAISKNKFAPKVLKELLDIFERIGDSDAIRLTSEKLEKLNTK